MSAEKEIKKEIHKIEKSLRGSITEKEPAYIRLIKILVILIPVIVLAYLFINQFFLPNTSYFFYDIGSQQESYLTPKERVSNSIQSLDSTENYRNITSPLVYFDIPIESGAETVSIDIRFRNNFPQNSKLVVGAKDQEEWHYLSKTVYSPTIEYLINNYKYEQKGSTYLFKINKDIKEYTISEIKEGRVQAVIATDQNIDIPQFTIPDYTPGSFEIDTPLRGTHNFYVYIKGPFETTVEKRDLNWYENPDVLYLNLYSLNGSVIANTTIKDDGIDEKKQNKTDFKTQKTALSVNNLKEGVYRLELKNNEDMIITKLSLNQNKVLVKDKVFPASSSIYFTDLEDSVKLYFLSSDRTNVNFLTYHLVSANQTAKVDDQRVRIEKEKEDYEISLEPSITGEMHQVSTEKGNVIISRNGFFSFSETSWFSLINSRRIDFKEDIKYLEKNADYVLVDYAPIEYDHNNWKIAHVSFNISELYVKDDKLNILINTPHLNDNRNDSKTMYLPVDWINISVYRPARV